MILEFLEKIEISHACANQSLFVQSIVASFSYFEINIFVSFWGKCHFNDSANVTNGNRPRTNHILKAFYCLENYLLFISNSRKKIHLQK